jgi:hypothetical protein
MTPKEKANKLRYQIESSMQDADMRGHYNQAIKQCALIAVDEILLYLKNSDDVMTSIKAVDYWQEVKNEIESL